MTKTKKLEKEKIVSKQINGRLPMIGFLTVVGNYIITGQIIPGIA